MSVSDLRRKHTDTLQIPIEVLLALTRQRSVTIIYDLIAFARLLNFSESRRNTFIASHIKAQIFYNVEISQRTAEI